MAEGFPRVCTGASLAAVAGSMLLWLCQADARTQEVAVLENELVRLEVVRSNGAFARIVDKTGGARLEPPGKLADSFRVVLRGGDGPERLVIGRDQRLSSLHRVGDGLDLAWDGPLADADGQPQDLRVTMTVRLAGPALEFRLTLRNGTAQKVAEVWYPVIGGLEGVGRGAHDGQVSVMAPTATPTLRQVSYPFPELALHYPAQLTMSYSSVFCPASGRALYFASHDTVARLKYYRFRDQSTPTEKDVLACITHVPYTPTGGTFEGSPVVLRFHDGGWEAAGRLYREWFEHAFGLMDASRSWLRRQSFLQDTMFLLPEGTLNLAFRDIPRWARDARDCGVTSVLISGWHRGGHDNGYPHYEPDPRLGTYDELKEALAACHQMGVRVYFFVNYQPAMVESEWFKSELNQYLELREDGGHGVAGWGMGTLWARMGHPKAMAWVDPSFPAYRDALLRQFLRLVAAGADGLHVDKMYPTPLTFNPRCTLGPDTSTWEGALQLTRMLMDEARKINPEFALSFEGNWDRMLTYASAEWWVGNMALARTVFPEMVETRSIASPYDYLGVNNTVRLNQVGLLGPLNYCRSVGWAPWRGLSTYIREVKRIQDGLSELAFLGEPRDASAVTLGCTPGAGVEYNVYRGRETGRRMCILTNSDLEDHEQVITAFEGTPGGRVRVHTPFAAPHDADLPAVVPVPSERIVFVEELAGMGTTEATPAATEAAGERCGTPPGPVVNGGFETGDFTGWVADPNWCVDRNSCGEYRGWEGACFAWSGGQGEAATGALRSNPFVLDSELVRVSIAGWSTLPGSDRTWNYVALKTADGQEIDRRIPLNDLHFRPVYLDGTGHVGEQVYLEAVDEAAGDGFSMFCIDDVRTVAAPPGQTGPAQPLPPFDAHATAVLEDDRYRVEVDRADGSITRILDKAGHLELIREPRLAESFRFTLPLSGREPWEGIEANYLLGRDQALSECAAERNALRLSWQGPLKSRTGEAYDVSVTMGIALEGEAVRFTMTIANHTPYPVGEVHFPILGGITGLGETRQELRRTQLVRPGAAGCVSTDIFRVFVNQYDLGDQGPEQAYLYPQSLPEPWADILAGNGRRSVLLGVDGAGGRALALHLEMLPGNAQTLRWDGNWPRPGELNGEAAGVQVAFVDFANRPAGETYEAPALVLQAHDGGWQEGQQVYRRVTGGH